jgi:multidrug efflux pump subunit AcrA (membrane-fusion protein)
MGFARLVHAAFVALVASAALATSGCSAAKTATGAAATDDWAVVRHDDLVLGVEVTGTLNAVDADLLGPPVIPDLWDFKVSFMAPEGVAVKKGEHVLGFDDSQLARKLLEKQNEAASVNKQIEKKLSDAQMARRDDELKIAEAEAKLRKAQLKVDVPTDLVGSLELAKAKVDADVAKKEVAYTHARAELARQADAAELTKLDELRRRAEERVGEIQRYMGMLSIGSPRDGIVIYHSDRDGQKKKVGDSTWRAEKILETDDLSVMMARGDVDEVDSSRIAVGQPVTVRLDAHPDMELGGKVSSIARVVTRKSSKDPLKVMRLEIAFDKTEPHVMLPGMRFRGSVETGRVKGALLVPVDAIFVTESGPFVWRKTATGAEKVRVEVGLRNRDLVEVCAGLAEGDRVSRTDLGLQPARATGGPP